MTEPINDKARVLKLAAEIRRLRKIICQFGQQVFVSDYYLPLETIEAIVQIMAEDKEAGQ